MQFCGDPEGRPEDKCKHTFCALPRSAHRRTSPGSRSTYCPGTRWTMFTENPHEVRKTPAHKRPNKEFDRLPLDRCVHTCCRLKANEHYPLAGDLYCPGWGIVDMGYFRATGLDKIVLREGYGEALGKKKLGLVSFRLFLAAVAPSGALQLRRKLLDNTRGEPLRFELGRSPPQVIQGWEVGCLGMLKGEVSLLVCGPDKAYGHIGVPSAGIPQDAVLAFELELRDVVPLIHSNK